MYIDITDPFVGIMIFGFIFIKSSRVSCISVRMIVILFFFTNFV